MNSRFTFGITSKIPRVPSVLTGDFGRIGVVLGKNGSGKSQLLQSLFDNPLVNGSRRYTVLVEGGRSIALPDEHPVVTNVAEGYKHKDRLRDPNTTSS